MVEHRKPHQGSLKERAMDRQDAAERRGVNPGPNPDPKQAAPQQRQLSEGERQDSLGERGPGVGPGTGERPGPHITDQQPQQGMSSSELNSASPVEKERATKEAEDKPDNTNPKK